MKIYEILIFIAYFISFFISMFYLLTFIYNNKRFKTIKSSKDKIYTVSVLIPAYNKEKELAKTIRSVLNQTYPKDKIEIIVINDGSIDSTEKIARSFKQVNVITKKNGGKAKALNDGIKKAKGELIACLDADTFMNPDLIRKSVTYFYDDDVAVAVPTLKPYKPRNILEKIQVVEYTLSSFTRKILSFKNSSSAAPACSFFRKNIFEKYGGFDEDNITEDFEMALKIQSKDHKLVHLTDAIAYTEVPRNFKSLFRQRLRWCYGNLYNLRKYKKIFGTKYGDFGVVFLPMMLISILLSLSILFFGIIDIIKNIIHRIVLAYKINFSFDFNLFNMDRILFEITNPKTFLAIIIFIMSIIIVYLAKIYTRQSRYQENLNGTNISIFMYLIYAFVYSLILVNIWIIAIFYMIFNKKPSW